MKYKKIRLLYELQNYVVQALRAVSHNYPNIMSSYWQQVSAIVFKILEAASPEVPAKAWKGHVGNTAGFIGEKVVTAAIKVLSFSSIFVSLALNLFVEMSRGTKLLWVFWFYYERYLSIFKVYTVIGLDMSNELEFFSFVCLKKWQQHGVYLAACITLKHYSYTNQCLVATFGCIALH